MTMIVNRSKLMLTGAALVAALAGTSASLFAQQRTSEEHIRDLVQQAAQIVASGQVGAPTTAQQGGQTTPPAEGPKVSLTLDDAVKLALDRNLDIAVQRLNPQINDLAYASARSFYNPNLTSTIQTQSTTQASTNTIQGGSIGSGVTQGTSNFNGGVAQSLLWGGGNYAVSLNNTRGTTDSALSRYNPSYSPLWSAQYTQPLLRGFKIDSTRQQLQVTKLSRDISDIQLTSTITNTLSTVRNAYWDYVFAIQAVDVARQSVDLAQKLVGDNQTRVQVGTMAPIDVVQAQAQAATAQQNLVGAQATMRTAELVLKRLIVSGTQDPNWNATIDPVDRPDFRPETIDVEAAVRRALSQRTDLAIASKDVQINDVTLRYLADQTRPQADFAATYGLSGVGGTQLIRTGTGIAGDQGVVTGTIPGGYSNSLASLLRGDFPRWTVGVNISYPLGVSAQQAAVARARVQLNQVQAQLKQVELQIATEVTNAAINVRSNAERVQAAQVARELAQRQLDAENSKFAVGMSTNYFVVQAQNQLATAQNNELQSVLNYRKALVELDRLQQTTLQNLNITVVGR
jgi:outer membrane protein TolC